ncbi:fibro-slime domain-containing protein [Candidatus Saccharibacteria bacterium]|nr:fibro-slime domain-containing protein [Candidatus Saccharibacteria bacterium]
MKKQNTGLIISLSILGLAVLAMIGLVGGVNGAVDDLEVALNENTANVILASAEVKNDTVVSVPILYYDQVMDECVNLYDGDTTAIRARQFEWDTCGYHESKLETGLVGAELDAEFLPVGVGGELLSNSGLSGDSFSRWFKSVEGKSKSYASVLSLTYDDRIASFGYRSEDFYPLDEIDLAADESVNSDGHNHLFTLSLGVPFRVLADGREEFSIEADDDTWVFVGNSLVIDMGGVHDAMMGRFRINEVGEVYAAVGNIEFAYTGVTLNEGDGAIVRIFHADRNSKSSLFGVRMTNMVPNVMNTTLAKSEGSVEVAYDPANPSYVAPLGESLAVGPDNRQSLMAMIVIQVVTLGAMGALVVVSISVAYRYSRRDRNQVK